MYSLNPGDEVILTDIQVMYADPIPIVLRAYSQAIGVGGSGSYSASMSAVYFVRCEYIFIHFVVRKCSRRSPSLTRDVFNHSSYSGWNT